MVCENEFQEIHLFLVEVIQDTIALKHVDTAASC